MSANRYIIKICTSYGDREISLKLKTIVGKEEEFLQELKTIDWEKLLIIFQNQTSKACINCNHNPCICDFHL
jgi:hypothetical protein